MSKGESDGTEYNGNEHPIRERNSHRKKHKKEE